MATPTLLEKLAILFEVSKSSVFFIAAIIFIVFIGLILITTNRLNVKSSRKLFILIYIFIITGIIVLYKESLFGMYNYLMENLFVIVYFPNLAIYFAAIIITNIILWFSVFNFKTHSIIKNINIIVYLLMSYLLLVLLSIVNTEKLDVFNQTSIYTNQSAHAIIELSSMLFVTWIIFLIIYKAIMTYLTRNERVVINNNVKIKKMKKKKSKKTQEEDTPVIIQSTPMYTPIINRKEDTSMYENLLTVEDYKLLLNILKEKKDKEKIEIEQNVKIEDNSLDNHKKEYDKFQELKDLYGVR